MADISQITLPDESSYNLKDAEARTSLTAQQNLIQKAFGVEMTLAQYNVLTETEKMDGTVRYITDVNTLPTASGVSF